MINLVLRITLKKLLRKDGNLWKNKKRKNPRKIVCVGSISTLIIGAGLFPQGDAAR